MCAANVFVEDASDKSPSCPTSIISLLLGEQYKAGAPRVRLGSALGVRLQAFEFVTFS